jgi:hypothetical protein
MKGGELKGGGGAYERADPSASESLKMLFGSATQCVCGCGTPLPRIWGVGLSWRQYLTFVMPYPY